MKTYRKKALVLFLITLCSLGTFSVYADDDIETEYTVQYPKMNLLVVVDRSGSMKPESQHVYDVLKMMCQLIEGEEIAYKPELIVFDVTASSPELLALDQINPELFHGETNIMCGITKANEWLLKKREDTAENMGIIIFSDLLATRSLNPEGVYTVGQAAKDEETLNEIIENWSDLNDKGELSYLCITWDALDDYDKNKIVNTPEHLKQSFSEETTVGEVQFHIKGQKKLELTQESNTSVSNRNSMETEVIREVMEMMTGQALYWEQSKHTGKSGEVTLDPEDSYETFVMVHTESDTVELRKTIGEKYELVPPFWESQYSNGTEKIYIIKSHADEGEQGALYRLDTGIVGDKVYVMEIPKLTLKSWFSKSVRYAGEEFKVKAQFVTDRNDVRRKPIKNGLFICITDEAGNKVLERPLDAEDGDSSYSAGITLEEKGVYKISFYGNKDKMLTSHSFMVKEHAEVEQGKNPIVQTENDSQISKKTIPWMWKLVGIIISVGLFALGIHKIRR